VRIAPLVVAGRPARLRLHTELQAVRVVDLKGVVAGFTMLRGAEVYQFYVAASARGTGAATALMQDAEAHIAARGVKRSRSWGARSATFAPHGSTRRSAGAVSGTSPPSPRLRKGRSRFRCANTKSTCRRSAAGWTIVSR
jgi:GNAT superfamily N-acetyltransferase